MRLYRVSREARDDLNDIWDYIATENAAPEAADRLMDRFYELFCQLGIHPFIGRGRPEFEPEIRSFPEGNYIVFYRSFPEGVEIARVLHGARNLEAIFGKE